MRVLGRSRDGDADWFQNGVLDKGWGDVLKLNLWREETMDKVACLLEIENEWNQYKTSEFVKKNKWTAHRNKDGELYMYQKQWLFHMFVGRYRDRLPFRKGFCEGKGRDTSCAQVCFGRYLDKNTGMMSDKTLLSVDYFVKYKLIERGAVPAHFSIQEHLDSLMRGDISVNAFKDPSTFTLVTISDPDINLNDAMKIMRAKSKEISLNKITSNTPAPIDTICAEIIKPFAYSLTEDDFFYEADFKQATEKEPKLWEWFEPKSSATASELKTHTEREIFHLPVILDHPHFILYCKRPHDFEADKNMRTLLSTTPRIPTYHENEEMENNRLKHICFPPFTNTMYTLQINPGNENKNDTPKDTKKKNSKDDNPVNENRINTSKANMLYIAVKVAHVLFLAMKRSSKMREDLEVEFLELCRALYYWIRCFNVKAYFQNHIALTKTKWYTKLSKAHFFTDEKMYVIGATMFITTLIDSAFDHPCQHVRSHTDTRDLLQISTYGKNDPKDWSFKYIMKPKTALKRAKEKLLRLADALSAITNKEVILEDEMYRLSEFFLLI